MSEVGARWRAVEARVSAACRAAGRDPAEVKILAAVKSQSPDSVLAALGAGCRLIGHNRAQELTALAPELAQWWEGELRTHFIGSLQSNKVNQVVPLVDCVESVDRIDLARRLSRAAEAKVEEGGDPLDVLIQVNGSGSPTQGGVSAESASDFAGEVASLPALRVRGFMTIGAFSDDDGVVRASLEKVAQVREEYVRSGAPGAESARELSMGMSGDLELAIAAGSTEVRLGTLVFGPRPS